MSIISLIAALDEEGGIGLNNELLCHLPADLSHFKKITLNKPIIMGRHTYESIGKPLPQRTNIVLSRTVSFIPGAIVLPSLQEALNIVSKSEETMIIGGAALFLEALEIAQRLYITHIHHRFKADTFFPKMDKSMWQVINSSFYHRDEKNSYDMTFLTYVRSK